MRLAGGDNRRSAPRARTESVEPRVELWFCDRPEAWNPRAVELFDIVLRMDGLRSFAVEAAKARRVRLAAGVVVPVLPLDRIIASKRAAGREKDRIVLPVLEDALAASSPPAKKTSARTRTRL